LLSRGVGRPGDQDGAGKDRDEADDSERSRYIASPIFGRQGIVTMRVPVTPSEDALIEGGVTLRDVR